MNESWYISATPWVGCPFKLNLIVLTSAGKEDAIKNFRIFYKNDALEPEEVYPITVITSDKFNKAEIDVGATKVN